MATTQHYVWATGHFLLLTCALRYFLATVTFKTVSPWWYKASFTGALVSYSIVCSKSLGTPQPNLAFINNALLDENVQYFLLAIFWWTSKPVQVALLPYAIFSLFHALTFTRTTIMPNFLPPGPPATAGGPPAPHPLAKKLSVWVKSNYDSAMRVVAYVELVILLRVLLGALTFQNSLLAPIIFAHFLRQRYYHSAFTRNAVAVVKARLDGYIDNDGVPPVARQVWTQAKNLIGKWGGSILVPADAQAAPRRQ